jgi:hypothetical protein
MCIGYSKIITRTNVWSLMYHLHISIAKLIYAHNKCIYYGRNGLLVVDVQQPLPVLSVTAIHIVNICACWKTTPCRKENTYVIYCNYTQFNEKGYYVKYALQAYTIQLVSSLRSQELCDHRRYVFRYHLSPPKCDVDVSLFFYFRSDEITVL